MKILIIEDAPEIVDTISLCFELRWPGAEIASTPEGREGIALSETLSPDIIILDLGLPDMDGFDVLKEIRAYSNVPIIIVTVRGDEIDKVRGLELGSDDYVTKPFSHIELLARVQAVIRRSNPINVERNQKPFASSRLTVDFTERTVFVEGNLIKLTPTESNLLYYLAMNPNTTLTHRALLETVWGEEYNDSPEYLKVYIQRLRNKLEVDPSNPKILISQRGVGYKFIAPL